MLFWEGILITGGLCSRRRTGDRRHHHRRHPAARCNSAHSGEAPAHCSWACSAVGPERCNAGCWSCRIRSSLGAAYCRARRSAASRRCWTIAAGCFQTGWARNCERCCFRRAAPNLALRSSGRRALRTGASRPLNRSTAGPGRRPELRSRAPRAPARRGSPIQRTAAVGRTEPVVPRSSAGA